MEGMFMTTKQRSSQMTPGASRSVAFLVSMTALWLAAPGIARAASFIIDDTSPNETITVSVNDFEFGFDLNGSLFQQGLNNPQTTTFSESGPFTFSGTWITNGAQPSVSGTIYLVEALSGPLDPPPPISDIFDYSVVDNGTGTATITGSFVSDTEGNLGLLPAGTDPSTVFFEDGTPVDFGFAFLSISIQSDAVPEPGTALLLGSGLMGLAFYGRRGRKGSPALEAPLTR
jgi:hypothetical protein